MEEVTNNRQHMIALVSSLNILMFIDGTSVPISGFSKPDLDTLPSGCLGRRMTNAAWEDMQSRHSQRDCFVTWVLEHRGHKGHFLLSNNCSAARQPLQFLSSF